MQKSSKIVPKGGKDCHSDPKGVQRVRKGIQRDPKDTPMDTQRDPNSHPNVAKMVPERAFGEPIEF